MRQSSIIFFYLVAAFIVFITQKGELPAYLGLLLLSPPQQPTGSGTAARLVVSTNPLAPGS